MCTKRGAGFSENGATKNTKTWWRPVRIPSIAVERPPLPVHADGCTGIVHLNNQSLRLYLVTQRIRRAIRIKKNTKQSKVMSDANFDNYAMQ